MLVVIFVVITWPILAGQERFESKARRLLKLAADSIDETSAGFTSRPYSAGKAIYAMEDIHGFARYLKSKHVVNPIYRDEGVYMTFSMGRSVLKNHEPSELSYVLFSKDGQISVHMAAFDYKQYTRKFTFDQLCSSLGNTFHRFLKYYNEGHEERIINELKSV